MPWPWQRRTAPAEGSLERGVADCRERLDRLERSADQLAQEWASVLDRIARWSAREAARKRRRLEADLDAAQGDGEIPASPAPPRPLSRAERLALLRARKGQGVRGGLPILEK